MLGYIQMNEEHEAAVAEPCGTPCAISKHVATCLGFGPRFLHSTGQAYKGGPNSGVFLQITCDDASDLPVPGQKYTFGIVKAAQARGDFQVLADRSRRALRVHLGSDLKRDLTTLAARSQSRLWLGSSPTLTESPVSERGRPCPRTIRRTAPLRRACMQLGMVVWDAWAPT